MGQVPAREAGGLQGQADQQVLGRDHSDLSSRTVEVRRLVPGQIDGLLECRIVLEAAELHLARDAEHTPLAAIHLQRVVDGCVRDVDLVEEDAGDGGVVSSQGEQQVLRRDVAVAALDCGEARVGDDTASLVGHGDGIEEHGVAFLFSDSVSQDAISALYLFIRIFNVRLGRYPFTKY